MCYQLEKIARIVCLKSVLHLDVQGKLYRVKRRHCPPDNPGMAEEAVPDEEEERGALEGLASKELELVVTNRSRMGEESPPWKKQDLWLGSSLRGRGAGAGWQQPWPQGWVEEFRSSSRCCSGGACGMCRVGLAAAALGRAERGFLRASPLPSSMRRWGHREGRGCAHRGSLVNREVAGAP